LFEAKWKPTKSFCWEWDSRWTRRRTTSLADAKSSVVVMAARVGDWEAVSQTHQVDGYDPLLGYVVASVWPMFDKRMWFPDGPGIFLANNLISSYARLHEISDARKVFGEMLKENVVL
jgi:pentatricopeptide repeat protein